MSLAEIHKKAKLVMIPSGFKADEILYSVLPNDGSGNFTASGDTDSTRVNKDGLIEKVTTLVPRLNYDFGNPKNPHLLLESQSTNLSTNSEAFDSWTNGSTYVTANQAVSPDGNTTADQLAKTSAFQQIQNTATVVSGSDYSFSVFVKENTLDRITLRLASGSNDVRKCLDLGDLSVVDAGGNATGFVETKVEKYSNGWYKYTVVATTNDTLLYMNIYAGKGDVVESGNIYIWGAQLEKGNYPTSYIPTVGSTVTRSQDTCTGGGSSSIFNDSEGTLFLEISRPINDSTTRSVSISDGSSSDRVIIQYISGFILGIVASGTTTVATLLFSTTSTSLNKIALRYKKNDFAMYVNGTQAGTDTNGNAPVGLSSFDFNDGTGSQKYEGQCAQAMYFDTALTNAELTTLTT
jgi:hypothetical protein